ncbi:MAG: hypothetical protein RR565_11305 [Erysipelothrix sp.]
MEHSTKEPLILDIKKSKSSIQYNDPSTNFNLINARIGIDNYLEAEIKIEEAIANFKTKLVKIGMLYVWAIRP